MVIPSCDRCDLIALRRAVFSGFRFIFHGFIDSFLHYHHPFIDQKRRRTTQAFNHLPCLQHGIGDTHVHPNCPLRHFAANIRRANFSESSAQRPSFYLLPLSDFSQKRNSITKLDKNLITLLNCLLVFSPLFRTFAEIKM